MVMYAHMWVQRRNGVAVCGGCRIAGALLGVVKKIVRCWAASARFYEQAPQVMRLWLFPVSSQQQHLAMLVLSTQPICQPLY
jgi:hypothetical protein